MQNLEPAFINLNFKKQIFDKILDYLLRIIEIPVFMFLILGVYYIILIHLDRHHYTPLFATNFSFCVIMEVCILLMIQIQ